MNHQQANREALQAASQQNEYQQSIAIWREGERKAIGWLTRILKRMRKSKQKQSVELELFRDQFEYETGLDSRKEGKRAFHGAVLTHLQRATKHAEQRLERELQGPLADGFDDEPFVDLLGDKDFEAAILKQQPELKKFKQV
jgi:hypothetical protein